jgi:hypothetical protein
MRRLTGVLPRVLPGRVEVREVRLSGRHLVDVGDDDPAWSGGKLVPLPGAIVRIVPGPGRSPAEVEALAARFRAVGAAAVRVVARPGNGRRALAATAGVPAERRTVREVVAARVQALRAGDGELAALVEQAMTVGEAEAPPAVVPSAPGPIWVAAVVLKNWQRYRGEHRVALDSTAYGVVARLAGDERRSNWLGKSTLLGAVPFALYGWHERPTDDDWITAGEDEGGVSLVLSDGATVERTKRRGKSTQLVFARPGRAPARQEEAQKEIAAHVGLSRDDFFALAFFRQKRLSRLATAQPAELLQVVSGWVGLGPLRAAEEWVRDELDKAVENEAWRRQRLADVRATVEQQRRQLGIEEDVDPGDAEEAVAIDVIDELTRERDAAKAEADRRREAIGAAGERWSALRDAVLHAGAKRELDVVLAAIPDEDARARHLQERDRARAAAEESAATARVLGRAAEEKRRLTTSGFDGRCPVAAIECPATAQINARAREHREAFEAASHRHREALEASGGKAADRARAEAEVDADRRAVALAEELRREEERLRPAGARLARVGEPPLDEGSEEERAAATALDAAVAAEMRLSRARHAAETLTAARKEEAEEEAAVEVAVKRAALCRDALAVVGRAGAQRDVAVEELGAVEAGANALLAEAGVELSVRIRWGRASSTELAVSCEACGATLPASKRVKSCPRCGAERGPRIDDKVDIELSNRSGAADDLAGMALQLAASAWLRARRGAGWSVAFIDEPFGALDEANCHAVAAALASLLRGGGGFAQALVVSHGPGTLDAFPGRVVVRAEGASSRVEEVRS